MLSSVLCVSCISFSRSSSFFNFISFFLFSIVVPLNSETEICVVALKCHQPFDDCFQIGRWRRQLTPIVGSSLLNYSTDVNNNQMRHFFPACKERISLSAFCGQFIKMIAFIWQIDQMWIVCDERRMRKEKRSREGNKNEMCLWWRLPYNDELMQAYYFDRCECHTFNKQCKRRRIYF